ncbi:MAG: hypothetical protein U0235_18175 [Polyangiaceae bacterium]
MNAQKSAPSLAALVALVVVAFPRTATAEDDRPLPEDSALTPAAPAATRDAPSEEKKPDDGDDETLRVGVLGGIGFPRPLSIEGMVKVKRTLGLGVEYSLMPKIAVSGVEATFNAIAADARYFPFKGAFFIGLRAGHQRMNATSTVTVASYSITESATAEATFINPRIGFLFTGKEGFTIGIDAGVQVPLSSSLTTTLPKNLPTQLQVDSSMSKVAGTFGNDVTPTVDLLKVGMLF